MKSVAMIQWDCPSWRWLFSYFYFYVQQIGKRLHGWRFAESGNIWIIHQQRGALLRRSTPWLSFFYFFRELLKNGSVLEYGSVLQSTPENRLEGKSLRSSTYFVVLQSNSYARTPTALPECRKCHVYTGCKPFQIRLPPTRSARSLCMHPGDTVVVSS